MGLNASNTKSPQLSSKNLASISLEPARRSTRTNKNPANINLELGRRYTCANKNRSKTRVSKVLGECKADEKCGNL